MDEAKSVPKDGITFVMDNDGIVFEWKNSFGGKKSILYRKQKMDLKELARSYLYSMTTYMDECFSVLDFLNWSDQKPSTFFKERVLDNYSLHTNRALDSQAFTRPPSQLSNNQNVNFYSGQVEIEQQQTDHANFDKGEESEAGKCFTRTIESKRRV